MCGFNCGRLSSEVGPGSRSSLRRRGMAEAGGMGRGLGRGVCVCGVSGGAVLYGDGWLGESGGAVLNGDGLDGDAGGGDPGGAVLYGLGLVGELINTGVDTATLLCDVCMELPMCAAVAAGGGTTTLVGVGACDGREDSPACWGGAASSSWVLRGTVCVVSLYLMFILRRTTGAVILHTGMSPGLRFMLPWCAISDDSTSCL